MHGGDAGRLRLGGRDARRAAGGERPAGVGDRIARQRLAAPDGEHQVDQAGRDVEHRHERLRLGIAEPAVELDDARSGLGEHEASVEQPGEGSSARAEGAERRGEDVSRRLEDEPVRGVRVGADLLVRVVAELHGEVGAHAAGVRAHVVGQQALMVLEAGKDDEVAAVGDGEEGDFLALHELLDEHRGAGGAEPVALEHVVDRAVGVAERLADDDALSGGEAGGFDDDGRAEATGGSLGAGDRGVDLGARGRDPLVEQELLGERLGRLDLGGGARRSEDRQTGGAESVDDARLERSFGTDDGEVDGALAREPLEGVDVEHVDRHALSELGDPGVARRGDQLEVGLFTGQLPRERVLATATADEENSHGREYSGGAQSAPPCCEQCIG